LIAAVPDSILQGSMALFFYPVGNAFDVHAKLVGDLLIRFAGGSKRFYGDFLVAVVYLFIVICMDLFVSGVHVFLRLANTIQHIE